MASGEKKLPCRPEKRQDRQKNQRNDERREHHSAADFERGVEDHVESWARIGQGAVFAQAAQNVFDIDNGIIDHFANRHGQAAKRDRVQRNSKRVENHDGGEKRKRNGC
jgi:hypothetical protein